MAPRKADLTWSELKLGIAVIALTATAVVTILAIGSTRGPFQPDTLSYRVELDRAAGIRVGSLVRVAGMAAGEVTDVAIVPPEEVPRPVVGGQLQPAPGTPAPPNIRLELSIREGFRPHITESSRAQLATLGMGGEKYVKITAGDVRERALPPGSTIDEVPSVDWDLIIARFNRAITEMGVLAANLEEIRAKMLEGGGTAGRLLNVESPLYPSLRRLADESERTLRSFDEGEGVIPAYRKHGVLEDRIERIQADLRAIDSLSERGLGRWRDLTELTNALADLEAEVEDLRARLGAGQGSLGRLLYDQELWIQVRVLQLRTAELMAAIRANPLGFVQIRLF